MGIVWCSVWERHRLGCRPGRSKSYCCFSFRSELGFLGFGLEQIKNTMCAIVMGENKEIKNEKRWLWGKF